MDLLVGPERGITMGHDTPCGTCTFRDRIPTGYLRRSFGGRIKEAMQRDEQTLDEGGASRRTLPNFGQVYGTIARRARESLPDFEQTLADRDRATSLFSSDARAFADAISMVTSAFDVDECVITPDGFAMVGVYSSDRRVEIRPGDAFLGGAVFSVDLARGTCTISARLVRLACASGLVLPLRAAEGVQSYERSPTGEARGSIEETVHRAFSGAVLQQSVRPLGQAASWHVTDPIATLAQFGVALDETTSQELRRIFQAAADPTVYGAVSALTQAARDTLDIRTRLELERKAGRLLPRLDLLGQQMLSQAALDVPEHDPVRS